MRSIKYNPELTIKWINLDEDEYEVVPGCNVVDFELVLQIEDENIVFDCAKFVWLENGSIITHHIKDGKLGMPDIKVIGTNIKINEDLLLICDSLKIADGLKKYLCKDVAKVYKEVKIVNCDEKELVEEMKLKVSGRPDNESERICRYMVYKLNHCQHDFYGHELSVYPFDSREKCVKDLFNKIKQKFKKALKGEAI